jgi:hypothetical protein
MGNNQTKVNNIYSDIKQIIENKEIWASPLGKKLITEYNMLKNIISKRTVNNIFIKV